MIKKHSLLYSVSLGFLNFLRTVCSFEKMVNGKLKMEKIRPATILIDAYDGMIQLDVENIRRSGGRHGW